MRHQMIIHLPRIRMILIAASLNNMNDEIAYELDTLVTCISRRGFLRNMFNVFHMINDTNDFNLSRITKSRRGTRVPYERTRAYLRERPANCYY